MVGGVVIEVIVLPERVWVNCEEERSSSRCAIYVERNEKSERIKPADQIWWQGGWAMWTPYYPRHDPSKIPQRAGFDYDIKIPRIGCSGVKRP